MSRLPLIQKAADPMSLFQLYKKVGRTTLSFKEYMAILDRLVALNKPRPSITKFEIENFQHDVYAISTDLQHKWKVYVATAQIGYFETLTNRLANDIADERKFDNVKQLSIYFWCLGKSLINKKNTLIPLLNHFVYLLNNPAHQQSGQDPFIIANLTYKTKDLVLILWSLKQLNLLNSETNKAINALYDIIMENLEEVEIKSIAILSQVKFGKDKQTKILDHIYEKRLADIEQLNLLTIKSLLVTMGYLKYQNQELALILVKRIWKLQGNKPLTAKFLAQICWSLHRMEIYERKVFSKLQVNGEQVMGRVNGLDLVLLIQVFKKVSEIHSDHTGFKWFLIRLKKLGEEMELDERQRGILEELD